MCEYTTYLPGPGCCVTSTRFFPSSNLCENGTPYLVILRKRSGPLLCLSSPPRSGPIAMHDARSGRSFVTRRSRDHVTRVALPPGQFYGRNFG
ncbi:hypothetical protein GDO81_026903 [Engystomops pustulosus]|uniref:Uncharacterized protein n=1 Tax=Engystomops pustulosus TaxID=76066 RepID=A0AAV6YN41_ENGPU|nr:hypothetical protein GDO81_026903 [Engystomops pustulosus]